MAKIQFNSLLTRVNPFRVLNHYNEFENSLENYFTFGGWARIGLDIGSHALKTTLIKPQGKNSVLSNFGIQEIEQTIDIQNADIDEVAVIQALREMLDENNIRSKSVNLSISDPTLYTRQIRIPKVKEDQLNRVIKQTAEKYVPFSIDEAIVDYQPIEAVSSDAEEVEIFIVAAKKSMVQKYLNILDEVKMTPNVMDISVFPTIKVLADLYIKDNETILPIIDIGHCSTTVVILQGKMLRFVRNFDLGGHHFTQAIASGLNTQISEAEKIKKESSLYPDKDDFKSKKYNINVHLEPVLENFLEQVQRCFAYCERDFMMENIEKALISGGGALLAGLARYLNENLNMNIELADPFTGLSLDLPPEKQKELINHKPMMCAALGLAQSELIKRD